MVSDILADIKYQQILRIEALADAYQNEADARFNAPAYRSKTIAGGKTQSFNSACNANDFAKKLRKLANKTRVKLALIEGALNPVAGL